MKIIFWPFYWHQEEICEEVDLEELQFLSSSSVLKTMKQKTYNEVLLFINKTVDEPCIASRRASISCRGSEDELFSQCRGKTSY